MKKFFCLLTDFGFDFAVASIKGVLLTALPDAQIIDIDHTVEKFNTLNAAFVIDKCYKFMPENSIFICVIDPGVGTDRDILCVQLNNYRFVGPNNGIFHYLFNKPGIIIHKIKQQLFNSESVTFHGRDIFAPAAINLANNNTTILETIAKKDLIYLQNLGDHINNGVITYIDSFGNIKTSIIITENFIPETYISLMINTINYTIKYTHTFLNVGPHELLCYKGSNNTLEIAVNLGSAKKYLNARVGYTISLLANN